jgi:multidrug efflux pump subunit AcrB
LRTLVGGDVATRFREGSEYYNIRLMIPEKKITSKNDIEDLPIALDGGVVLRIRDVATVSEAVGPVEIVREDKVKEVIVRGDAAGVSVGQAVQEMKSAMTKVELPPGYEISYGGQSQMMAEMRRTVLSIFAFALFFAFVVLVVQFNDLKMPLFIIAGVPVSLAGSIILLFITGLPLGATVIIGILVVVAANVMEGVLQLNYANELHIKEGRSPRDAVVHAARIRFRPRMMTSIGVLVGFLPLALNLEEGGDMLQPMATAAIGGLLATIVVTLFLVPSLYVLFTRVQKGRPQTESNTQSPQESMT